MRGDQNKHDRARKVIWATLKRKSAGSSLRAHRRRMNNVAIPGDSVTTGVRTSYPSNT